MIKKMTFAEKTKLRMNLGILIFIVGATTFALVMAFGAGLIGEGLYYEEFNIGFLSGIGGGLMGAGIATFYQHRKRLKDPVKLREAEIKENDERNIYLSQKALSISAMIWASLLYVGMVGAAFFFNTSNLSMILVACGGIALTIFLIVYTVLKKMY